jgi:hypothetical protein
VPSLHACRSTLEDPQIKEALKQFLQSGAKPVDDALLPKDLTHDNTRQEADNPEVKIKDLLEKYVKPAGYRARIRNHGHSCFLCEIVIRSQFHTTYEPEA